MIRAIMKLAGDEVETIKDAIDIAMETDEQLINRLIGLALQYKHESENLKNKYNENY